MRSWVPFLKKNLLYLSSCPLCVYFSIAWMLFYVQTILLCIDRVNSSFRIAFGNLGTKTNSPDFVFVDWYIFFIFLTLIVWAFVKNGCLTSSLLILISRYGTEHVAQINKYLDFLEEVLCQLIKDMHPKVRPTLLMHLSLCLSAQRSKLLGRN